ncbi:hypothetical protein NE865_09922 [Phthorimaea operculella]|nr:hypothetical protein NE865_09922 [Phthorimaea operculella]
MSFSPETPKGEFYTFACVPELARISEETKDNVVLCRTIGILHSVDGRFYLTDVDSPTLSENKPKIRITMVYMKTPPPSLVIPYPVQLFGQLQWRNRPVIFAKIVEVLTTAMATRARDTLKAVTSIHLATSVDQEIDQTELDVSYSQLDETFVLDSTQCNGDEPS